MCLMSHCMWIFSQVTLLVMSEHSLLSEITLWIRADEIDCLEEQRFSLKNRMLCMQVSSHYTGMMHVKNPHTANRSDTTIRTTTTTSSVRKKYQIRLLSPLSGSDFSPSLLKKRSHCGDVSCLKGIQNKDAFHPSAYPPLILHSLIPTPHIMKILWFVFFPVLFPFLTLCFGILMRAVAG